MMWKCCLHQNKISKSLGSFYALQIDGQPVINATAVPYLARYKKKKKKVPSPYSTLVHWLAHSPMYPQHSHTQFTLSYLDAHSLSRIQQLLSPAHALIPTFIILPTHPPHTHPLTYSSTHPTTHTHTLNIITHKTLHVSK